MAASCLRNRTAPGSYVQSGGVFGVVRACPASIPVPTWYGGSRHGDAKIRNPLAFMDKVARVTGAASAMELAVEHALA